MSPSGKCGCEDTILEGHRLVDYLCSKHRAALDLYEACKSYQTFIIKKQQTRTYDLGLIEDNKIVIHNKILKAVSKAETK